MKNKICFITQCNLPVPAVSGGAVETLIEYLIDENEIKKVFDFTVITVDTELSIKKQKEYKHTNFVHINNKNKTLNKLYSYVYRLLKKVGIYIPYSLESIDVLKYLKVHKGDFDYFVYEAGPTTQLPLINKIIDREKIITHLHWDGMGNKRISKSFNYLLPVSNYIGNNWANSCHPCSNKIITLSNCADISIFNKKMSKNDIKNMKKDLDISDKNFVILYIGRIVPEKGILEMLKGIEKSTIENIEIVIIGSPNFGKKQCTKYEKQVLKFSKKMKKKTNWIGYVDKKDLYKYYSISNLLIMPSVFAEPAGMVCIEAQTFGIPLMVSKTGGLPEYASNSTIFLNPRNLEEDICIKVEEFFNNYNSDNLNNLIQAGKNNALKYDKSEYYQNFINVFNKVGR